MKKNEKKTLTTGFGMPVDDDLTSPTAAEKGPVLIQDVHLTEKLAHFDRERIPERVVHVKGAGAHGYFEVTHDVTKYTRAAFLSQVGKRTDVFVRFSTVGGERGSADTERDPRGFAMKFYTDEGNYDLVGNNTPVFFIRDALKFPDFVRTQKRHPATNLKNADMFWDFLSLTPESLHQVTMLFSDRGTPRGYRHMNGYGSHTYMWNNRKGEHFWVNFHFKTEQGIQNFTARRRIRCAASTPTAQPATSPRPSPAAIFRLGPGSADHDFGSRPKPTGTTPSTSRRCGPIVTSRPSRRADGPQPQSRQLFRRSGASGVRARQFRPRRRRVPDKMLQGRLFSYHDTHRHRLGSNYHLLPINAPKAAMAATSGTGHARWTTTGAAAPTIGRTVLAVPLPMLAETPAIEVAAAGPARVRVGRRGLRAGGRALPQSDERCRPEHLMNNIVGTGNAQKRIQLRQTALFYKADPDYGLGVAKGLGLNPDDVKKLALLSQDDRIKATS